MMHEHEEVNVASGSVVVLRDEEWLVTAVEHTSDGWLLHCQGLSELVRDTSASFYEGLDNIQVLDPTYATVVADDSHYYRRSRLWLEATLRKTAVPLGGTAVTVSADMLADSLGYQQAAVRQALDPANLRTRILLADAVGLGKTLEIGMILSELIRRGRGERILIVTPRHVLEQMQHEMWSRFAIPFVRLDSQGIQRVRQMLPATRNSFTYFKRAIISIDTLKSDRYRAAAVRCSRAGSAKSPNRGRLVNMAVLRPGWRTGPGHAGPRGRRPAGLRRRGPAATRRRADWRAPAPERSRQRRCRRQAGMRAGGRDGSVPRPGTRARP
jgi:hypothetical protein